MNRYAIFGGMIGIAMLGADAAAQGTLGELLDAGAKKLSKEEIQAAFSGAHSTGKMASGANVQMDFKADGTYSGTVQSLQGGTGGVMGTWSVDAGGRLCVEWTPVGRGTTKGGGCAFYYTLAGDYYLSESGERNSLVLKRTLRK